ncbi:hypothetical protein PSHT_09383 [Puccinia striiformis]|uniref:NodB homology domain-containing protein n=1 Tax=Puccinia striiformis TaxID=27350 RepID=A0A2S4VH15_9BASI|nr:hypothetical protein PSHT_09383 [Puccinia striiformis]
MNSILYLSSLVALLSQLVQADPPTICSRPGLAALTFDDGPYDYQNQIGDYLHNRGINGTFFVNGNNYDCIYDEQYVQRLKRRPLNWIAYLVAPKYQHLVGPTLNQQLDLVERALMKILGVKPKFFRAPYGEHNKQSLDILAKRGYTVVDWSFDSGDSVGATPESSMKGYNKLARSFPPLRSLSITRLTKLRPQK